MNNIKLRMSPFCDKFPMNLTDLVRVLCLFFFFEVFYLHDIYLIYTSFSSFY